MTNLAFFEIAQRHAVAVAKYQNGLLSKWDLEDELRDVEHLAKCYGVPYVLPDNFLDIVRDEAQYNGYDGSTEYSYDMDSSW